MWNHRKFWHSSKRFHTHSTCFSHSWSMEIIEITQKNTIFPREITISGPFSRESPFRQLSLGKKCFFHRKFTISATFSRENDYFYHFFIRKSPFLQLFPRKTPGKFPCPGERNAAATQRNKGAARSRRRPGRRRPGARRWPAPRGWPARPRLWRAPGESNGKNGWKNVIYLFKYLYIYLSICISIYLSIYVYMYICKYKYI